MRKCLFSDRMQAPTSALLLARQNPLPPSGGCLRKGLCHQPGLPEPEICMLPNLGQHRALPAPETEIGFGNGPVSRRTVMKTIGFMEGL